MVNAKQVAGMVERFQKAQALVAASAVSPISGLDGYYVVRNGNGDSMYLVRIDAEHECCSCPDFQQRQKDAGMPCKHLLAAQLAADAAAKPAKKAGKAAAPISGKEAVAILNDEEAA